MESGKEVQKKINVLKAMHYMQKMKMNNRWCRALPRLTKLYKKLKHFSMRKVEVTRTVKTF